MLKNGRAAAIALGFCFLLASCRSAEVDTQSDDLSFNEPPLEVFTISLANIDPLLTQEQIDQSYWQRTSLYDHQLNIIEGVYLSEVGMILDNRLSAQNTISYSIGFRINNNTSDILYYTFPHAPPNAFLEKNINGEWYEIPLSAGAAASIRRRFPMQMQVYQYGISRPYSIDLSYWRLLAGGLYRLVVEITFDSLNHYYLSEEFEINRHDFQSRFAENQINSFDSIDLLFYEYNYEDDYLSIIIANNSNPRITVSFGLFFELEQYIDGIWYELPINRFSPIGLNQGGAFALKYWLYARQTFEHSIRLGNWHPLTVGTYRLSLPLSIEDGSPPYELDFFPVSAVFEIVD